jgi:hypothetical protein
MQRNRNLIMLSLVLMSELILPGCGDHPTPLRTAADIAKLPPSVDAISVGELPVEAFSLLSKFTNVTQIKFYLHDGSGGSDDKLVALSRLRLPCLKDVTLLNCPAVTDKGLAALTRIGSIQMLQLEGTSITDTSLRILSDKMKLKGINVANCTGVTLEGIAVLATSPVLEEIGFSADKMDEAQMLDLIRRFPHVKHWEIVDTAGKLDPEPVERLALQLSTQVVIQRTGALQNLQGSR